MRGGSHQRRIFSVESGTSKAPLTGPSHVTIPTRIRIAVLVLSALTLLSSCVLVALLFVKSFYRTMILLLLPYFPIEPDEDPYHSSAQVIMAVIVHASPVLVLLALWRKKPECLAIYMIINVGDVWDTGVFNASELLRSSTQQHSSTHLVTTWLALSSGDRKGWN